MILTDTDIVIDAGLLILHILIRLTDKDADMDTAYLYSVLVSVSVSVLAIAPERNSVYYGLSDIDL